MSERESMNFRRLLKERFGFEAFRPGQQDVLRAL
jgi:superfamily II DNA helicase RecQ